MSQSVASDRGVLIQLVLRRHLVVFAALLTVCIVLDVNAAFADTMAYVRCTSMGSLGTKSSVNVLDRFSPGIQEGQLIGLVNLNAPPGAYGPPRFVWEIFEPMSGSGNFYPLVHINYSAGEDPYGNDYYVWSSTEALPGWHSLELWQVDASHFTVRYDGWVPGNISLAYWWPHSGASGNMSYWGIEVPWVNLTSSSYHFMGRHVDCYLKASSGYWRQLNTDWSGRILPLPPHSPIPYHIGFNANYYDWQADRD